MQQDVEAIVAQARRDIADAQDSDAIERLRVSLLGKKGSLTSLLKQLGQLPDAERRTAGAEINRAKQAVQDALAERRAVLERQEAEQRLQAERIDVTLPGRGQPVGATHPLTRTGGMLSASKLW